MKRWIALISLMVGIGTFSAALAPVAHADGEARSKIYIFTQDFPPDIFFQHPQPPVSTTKFWKLLNHEIQERTNLELTPNLEEANYRVDLRCGGVVHCNRVRVDVMTPYRDVLTSYDLPGKILGFWPNVSLMSQRLATTLDIKIAALEDGGFGNYGLFRYRDRNYKNPQRIEEDENIKTISDTRGDSGREQPAYTDDRPHTFPAGVTPPRGGYR
jgi:hypothetical protein